jgi:phospholysine phosphohistidine inorganic pyrophosphate phosphatase
VVPGDDEPRRQALLRPVEHATKHSGAGLLAGAFLSRTMDLKGLLIDLDGTLYVEDAPISGAREALLRLEAVGSPYRFVTNTTRKPRREVVSRLRELGFPAREDLVLVPAAAANALLAGERCHALVAEALLEDLADVDVVDDGPAERVLVGDLGEGFDYPRLNKAFRLLMDGAELVALQRNRFWQEADGPSLDAGPFVAALEYASGKTATVVGKPEPAFFEAALRDLGLQAKDVAMVGDDAESDVTGARRAGLRGIQVKTGKYRPETAGEADAEIESIADLPTLLDF